VAVLGTQALAVSVHRNHHNARNCCQSSPSCRQCWLAPIATEKPEPVPQCLGHEAVRAMHRFPEGHVVT
jgi:hypothetical protein